MSRYDWTSLLSLSEVALSRMTAWLALSLTVRMRVISVIGVIWSIVVHVCDALL